jgi:hypothetical protein
MNPYWRRDMTLLKQKGHLRRWPFLLGSSLVGVVLVALTCARYSHPARPSAPRRPLHPSEQRFVLYSSGGRLRNGLNSRVVANGRPDARNGRDPLGDG